MKSQYSILIRWSNEERKYSLSLPEVGPYAHTHGDTYEEALKNGQEVLELLIEDYQARGKTLPNPINSDAAFQFASSAQNSP